MCTLTLDLDVRWVSTLSETPFQVHSDSRSSLLTANVKGQAFKGVGTAISESIHAAGCLMVLTRQSHWYRKLCQLHLFQRFY